jgi:nucleolar protein 56
MAETLYVLYESSLGYGIFEVEEFEEIGSEESTVQAAVNDLAKFGKICKLKAFVPFRSAQDALENINAVSEGIVHDLLKSFLETNMPKVKSSKKAKFQIGVSDFRIGQQIKDDMGLPCVHTGVVPELIRGIRLHFAKMNKSINDTNIEKAQLGLGHSYSRSKVKFNVHRSDNMIIQAISLLDQLDKDVNTFSMRIKEWYSYHFPELMKVVVDNYQFAKCAQLIKRRSSIKPEYLEKLEAIVMDSAKAQQIIDLAKQSMGMEVSDIDLINIDAFSTRVVALSEYRKSLHSYLVDKMTLVAPNLGALIGEQVGARLISHAGSLTNLAKYPASTVQILGAEKALFRALKTKSNTPKYGLIFHSTFIGRAGAKNKGRISRYLANKASIASRIDCFSENPSKAFGDVLREQVEERLEFYETGKTPRKNLDVMRGVIDSEAAKNPEASKKRKAEDDAGGKKKKKSKKGEKENGDSAPKKSKKEKKEKKSKKEKK